MSDEPTRLREMVKYRDGRLMGFCPRRCGVFSIGEHAECQYFLGESFENVGGVEMHYVHCGWPDAPKDTTEYEEIRKTIEEMERRKEGPSTT